MNLISNYFNTSIWTIVSFILVLLILIPLAFLSYSFTVDGTDIIREFSLFNFKEFFVDEIYIRTLLELFFLQ